MRALVIAPQPFFSPRGTPFSVYYRTLVMAQLGVAIDLLTYGEGQDVQIPGVRIVRIPRFRVFGPVRVGPSFLKLFLDCFLILWTIGLLLRRRYDFVHAHEEAVFWCRFLKPLFRFKLVYDMHSRLPQQLKNFGFTTSKTLIDIFQQLERTSLRNAEAIVTICPDLEEYIVASGIDPSRHVLIENSIFGEIQLDAAAAPVENSGDIAAIERMLESAPVVMYAGTFEVYQGIDLLLCAFLHVRRERPDAQLLLVGGTPDQIEHQTQLARELGIDEACVFTGRVSQTRAAALARHAHVFVSPRMGGTNTPLKIYELLASGKPLVATRIRAHTQVLTDDVCLLVEPEPEAMAAGILKALQAHASQAGRARSLYEGRYSRPAYEAKVRRLLESLS